jgi:hypothetical protein
LIIHRGCRVEFRSGFTSVPDLVGGWWSARAARYRSGHDDIKPRRVAEKIARWLAVDTASLAELRRLVEDGVIAARPWLVELLRDRDARGRNDDGAPGETR